MDIRSCLVVIAACTTLTSARADSYVLTIGVSAATAPSFEGSSKQQAIAYPRFGVRKVGTPKPFGMMSDSISWAALDLGQAQAGPAIALSPTADLDVEVGGFISIFPADWARIRFEARRPVSKGGMVGSISGSYVYRDGPWLAGAGPRFGLSDREGIKSVGAELFIERDLNEQVAIYGYVQYDRLTGNLARVSESPDQFMIGAGATYSFIVQFP